jgi:hypothetical protein
MAPEAHLHVRKFSRNVGHVDWRSERPVSDGILAEWGERLVLAELCHTYEALAWPRQA